MRLNLLLSRVTMATCSSEKTSAAQTLCEKTFKLFLRYAPQRRDRRPDGIQAIFRRLEEVVIGYRSCSGVDGTDSVIGTLMPRVQGLGDEIPTVFALDTKLL